MNLAHRLFTQKKYNEASQQISTLLEECKGNNKKIVKLKSHLALCGYMKTGCTQPEEYLETLNGIVNQYSKDLTTVDLGYVIYNQAVINYQLKRYQKSSSQLESLCNIVGSLDPYLGFESAYLFLKLCIENNHISQANDLVALIEKQFFQSNTLNKKQKGSQLLTGNQNKNKQRLLMMKIKLSLCYTENNKAELFVNQLQEIRNRNSQQQRIQENKQSQQKERQRGKLTEKELLNKNLSLNMMKCKVEHSKMNLEEAKNNLWKLSKMMENSKTEEQNNSSFWASFYNNLGCVDLKNNKPGSALFYFKKALIANSQICNNEKTLNNFSKDKRSEIMYNTGLCLTLLGKPENAFQFFQGALVCLYNRPRAWIRLAECCLLEHFRLIKDKKQKDSLNRLVKRVIGQGQSRTVILQTEDGPNDGLNINEESVSFEDIVSSNVGDLQFHGIPVQSMSLDYASKAASNSIIISEKLLKKVNNQKQKFSGTNIQNKNSKINENTKTLKNEKKGNEKENEKQDEQQKSENNSNLNSKSTTTYINIDHENLSKNDQTLKQDLEHGLLLLSYISLCCQNPVTALSSAKMLLNYKPEPYREYLANIYAAEACCLLNNPKLAKEYISKSLQKRRYQVEKLLKGPKNLEIMTPNEFESNWSDCVTALNMAFVSILQNDIQTASEYIKQASRMFPNSPLVLLYCVYLELTNNNIQNALELLKSCHAFYPLENTQK
ncbi:ccr4-not transcription complex subunit 10 [Anaeramoeba flamelloides]|uniref:Ccr4-not transcription complex subunit 10 n=1 Tax=Anaeramoeba flamelloides TaxID=1746091 RepID=A0ABQ8Y5B2_9EUKA|nr:ccr4-not transcription complex subunit 10 [Anaeramoeba flamelloides]